MIKIKLNKELFNSQDIERCIEDYIEIADINYDVKGNYYIVDILNSCYGGKETAQAIMNARALYPDSSLADLYDELTMPKELRKAHQDNDRAVMAAYGFSLKMTESECIAELMKMYSKLKQN